MPPMIGSPGPFEKIDIEESYNIADTFNRKSRHFPRTGPDWSLDKSEAITGKEPGSPMGRDANAIKRVEPFQHVDAVKAAGKLFKAAIFDPNLPDLPDSNPRSGASTSGLAPGALAAMVDKAPRIGDWAAVPPPGDTRSYAGVSGRAPFNDFRGPRADAGKPGVAQMPAIRDVLRDNPPGETVSRMYQPASEKAAEVPSAVPVSPQDEADSLKMKVDDPEEMIRQKVLTDQQIARPVSTKRGSFLSRFLRAGYAT